VLDAYLQEESAEAVVLRSTLIALATSDVSFANIFDQPGWARLTNDQDVAYKPPLLWASIFDNRSEFTKKARKWYVDQLNGTLAQSNTPNQRTTINELGKFIIVTRKYDKKSKTYVENMLHVNLAIPELVYDDLAAINTG